jgi:anti-sigma B factor antagonist
LAIFDFVGNAVESILRSLHDSTIKNPKSGQGESSIMAELNIRERQAGDVTVLDMDGRITIGEGSVALRSAVRRLLEEGKKNILLNLAGVGYIDSSGIGELVSSYTAINKEGGQLKLLSLTQKLRDLLTITKLLTVFDSYETEPDALSNFK